MSDENTPITLEEIKTTSIEDLYSAVYEYKKAPGNDNILDLITSHIKYLTSIVDLQNSIHDMMASSPTHIALATIISFCDMTDCVHNNIVGRGCNLNSTVITRNNTCSYYKLKSDDGGK